MLWWLRGRLYILIAMTMGLWVGRRFRVSAAVCLLGWATAAAAAGRPVVRPAAKPAARPVAAKAHKGPAENARVLTAHGVTARPRKNVKQTAPDTSAKAKPGSKSKTKVLPHTAKSKEQKAKPDIKPAPKAKRRKTNPEDEADGDPLVIYRATHDRRSLKGLMPKADDAAKSSGQADVRVPATSDDFMRAAGGAVAANAPPKPAMDSMERGESHPEESEKIEVARAPVVPTRRVVTAAVVTAGPEPVTPVGTGTLRERARSAAITAETRMKVEATEAKVAMTPKHAVVKAPILPEDPAERDAVIEAAMTPRVLPALYTAGGRLVVPPPMKGTHDILVHQNTMADKEGLDRIQDDEDLNRMRAAHLLVELRSSDSLEINEDLPMNRRYARPWTVKFVTDIARAYEERFHTALRLNSAVRTVSYQLRLQRVNGNAAAVDGDGASPHLTGQAIDFGKRGMSVAEIAWMRAYLGPVMDAGKIDVEEEFQQACFHISVYRSYVPAVKPKSVAASDVRNVAQSHAAPIVRAVPKGPDDDLQ